MTADEGHRHTTEPTPQPPAPQAPETLVTPPPSLAHHVTLVPEERHVLAIEDAVIEAAAKPFRYDLIGWISDLEWIVLYGHTTGEAYFIPAKFSSTKVHGTPILHLDLLDQFRSCRDLTHARSYENDNTKGKRFWRVEVGITDVDGYDQHGNACTIGVGGRCCKELLPLLGCLLTYLRAHPDPGGPSLTIELIEAPTEKTSGKASIHLHQKP